MDPTELLQRFPPIHLGFLLQEEAGFEPPPGVVALRGSATLDISMALGVHYFYTCLGRREPSFGLVEEFLSYSINSQEPHVFMGSGFSDDSEFNQSLSMQFSKFFGIAFMAERAGSTWFANLSAHRWKTGLDTPEGGVSFTKEDKKANGPDYLAAPFDPMVEGVEDPLQVLEFKGRSQRIEFHHAEFKRWQAQASNIKCTDHTGQQRRLKSWVLGFNYSFDKGTGCRDHSTLLVDDPWVGPEGAEPIPISRKVVAPIIREHLARQCEKFGAARLVPSVLLGGKRAPQTVFPQIYKANDNRLAARRYIGLFGSWGPNGEVLWSTSPRGFRDPALDGEIFIESSADDSWVHAHVRRRRLGIHIELLGRGGWRAGEAETWVRDLLSGGQDQIFVGQDATMLRDCIGTDSSVGLATEAFTNAIQISGRGDRDDQQHALQVLRNGGILASARLMHPVDEPGQWWDDIRSHR